MSRTRFIAGWIGSGILAGILAVAAVSIAGAENWIVLLLVAVLEGAVLGALQNAILRRRFPVHAWFAATLAGVVAGRGVQYVMESSPWMSAAYQWPHVAQLSAGAMAGLTVGIVTAVFQVIALRGRIGHAAWWLPARGMATALTFVFLGAVQVALGYPDVPLFVLVTLLLAIGAAAGAVEAGIEAPFMLALIEWEERSPRSRRLHRHGAFIRTQ